MYIPILQQILQLLQLCFSCITVPEGQLRTDVHVQGWHPHLAERALSHAESKRTATLPGSNQNLGAHGEGAEKR